LGPVGPIKTTGGGKKNKGKKFSGLGLKKAQTGAKVETGSDS